MNKVKELIKNETLLFDGGMGTYFSVKEHLPGFGCELVNLSQPVLIGAIHREYMEAGSRAIKTNTFAANRVIFQHDGEMVKRIIRSGMRIAVKAAEPFGAAVFADIGPVVGLYRKETIEEFVSYVIGRHGKIDCLINNALPLMKGINECTWEEFQYALSVGVTAPFYLSKLFAPYFAKGASIVNISSSRDRMSQPQTESYTAAKGGIAALTHAMAVSFSSKVRVNSVSPGWIDTAYTVYEGPDASQHPAGRVGNPLDIANTVLFLCSEKASFITGENICVDGGMTKLMIYHNDYGWMKEE